ENLTLRKISSNCYVAISEILIKPDSHSANEVQTMCERWCARKFKGCSMPTEKNEAINGRHESLATDSKACRAMIGKKRKEFRWNSSPFV
ncbi:hypothetical protein V1477_018742, partial [Vespula maculifrons]